MLKKRFAAIICEYNPFHYGHLYQIEFLKKEYDGIICIMSGNIVQRGEVAIADKYLRAKTAVLCGASLVVELPFPFSMLSARDFASAGVFMAAALGADALSFGCEDDFSLLTRISDVVSDNSFEQRVQALIKTERKLSYPKAKEALIGQLLGIEAAAAVKKPNNILTLEYLAAIKSGGYTLVPHPIARETTLNSSSFIRKTQDREAFLSLLPTKSAFVYSELNQDTLPRSTDNLSQYILSTLRKINVYERDTNTSYYSTPSDLFERIMSTCLTVTTFSELISACQNSLYTEARVRRSVLSIVFNIDASDALCKPSFALLLAADSDGCTYLKNQKKHFTLPIITKPAHTKKECSAVLSAFHREAAIDSILSFSSPKAAVFHPLNNTPFIMKNNK